MNKLSVSIKTPVGASPDYVAQEMEEGRRKLGNELLDILSERRSAIVNVEQIHKKSPPTFAEEPDNELVIEVTVLPI